MTEQSFAETLGTSEAVRFLTDAFPARISLIDTEHRYQFVNKFYQECHDKSREEIEGHHVRDLYGDKGYEAIRPHLERTEAGERSTVEVHVNDRDQIGITSRLLSRTTDRMAKSTEFWFSRKT